MSKRIKHHFVFGVVCLGCGVLALSGFLPENPAQYFSQLDSVYADSYLKTYDATELFSIDTSNHEKQDDDVVSILPGIPANTIKISPEQAAQGSVVLPFGASVVGADEETTVTYVANEDVVGHWNPVELSWTGDVYTEPILSPFNGSLDLSSFLAADQVEASVFVYALVNAVETTTQTTLMFDFWSHAVNHTIQVVDIDQDNNAFPDNITDIGPGEAWFSQLAFDEDVWRDVGILHHDPGNDKELLKQDIGNMTLQVGNVSVTAPNLAALENADFYDSSMFEIIDDAWLVLEVAPELQALIDDVDGDAAEEVIAAWAEEVAANQPGGLTVGSPFLNVKIAYRLMLDPQNIRTLDDLSTNRHGDPTGLSVSIEISELDIEHPDAVELWSYPTGLREAGNGFSAAAEVVEWVLRDEPSIDAEGARVVAIVDQLSIFAALESVMQLNSVSPNMVPVGVEHNLTLAGLFLTNTATALNQAEAQAAYEVLVGGESVDFREVDGEAVTAYVGGENFIYVTLPPQTEQGLLDVTVVDIVNEVDSTLVMAIEVVGSEDEGEGEGEGEGEMPDFMDAFPSLDALVAAYNAMSADLLLPADLTQDGLPQLYSLGLIHYVIHQNDGSIIWGATLNALELNYMRLVEEVQAEQLGDHKILVAAMLAISPEMQNWLIYHLANEAGIMLTGEYDAVSCDETGQCMPAMDGDKALWESYLVLDTKDEHLEFPFAADGDYDEDGYSNLVEYENVKAWDGTLVDFVNAATDPNWDGTFIGGEGEGEGEGEEPEIVQVPAVLGLTQNEAEFTINNANLQVGSVEMAYSNDVPEGNVISQNPEAGASVEEGSAVNLVVSLGPESTLVHVPDVEGSSFQEAQSILSASGLSHGNISEAYSDSVAAGHVISQNPEAGAEVEVGSSVDLVISMGAMPDDDAFLYGDVNQDGVVDFEDVQELIELIAQGVDQIPIDSPIRQAADVNRDGQISSDDVLMLLRYVNAGGLIDTAPQELCAESGGNLVTLFWRPISHPNLDGYAIYRRTLPGGLFQKIGSTTNAQLTDEAVSAEEYEYFVVAEDILGNKGLNSENVSVMANTVRVWLPDVWGKTGEEVRVPINLGNARGLNLRTMLITIHMDSDLLEFDRLDRTTLTRDVEFGTNVQGDTLRIISVDEADRPSTISGEGRFLDMVFKINPSADVDKTDIQLQSATILDVTDTAINTLLESGSVWIGDDSMWGDLNKDGVVDERDVQLLLDITVRKVQPTPYHYMVGDLNGDGRLDSADAVLLLRMINGESINPGSGAKGHLAELKQQNRVLDLPNITARTGQRITLPVSLNDVSRISGGDLIFSWPHDKLRLEALSPAGVFSDREYEVQSGPGFANLSFAGIDESAKSGSDDIAEIVFTVLSEPTTSMNPAPIVRINYTDLKQRLGESVLWFGDIELASAEIFVEEGELEDEPEPSKSPAMCGAGSRQSSSMLGNVALLLVLVVILLAHTQYRKTRL